jgi:hypothetical protein
MSFPQASGGRSHGSSAIGQPSPTPSYRRHDGAGVDDTTNNRYSYNARHSGHREGIMTGVHAQVACEFHRIAVHQCRAGPRHEFRNGVSEDVRACSVKFAPAPVSSPLGSPEVAQSRGRLCAWPRMARAHVVPAQREAMPIIGTTLCRARPRIPEVGSEASTEVQDCRFRRSEAVWRHPWTALDGAGCAMYVPSGRLVLACRAALSSRLTRLTLPPACRHRGGVKGRPTAGEAVPLTPPAVRHSSGSGWGALRRRMSRPDRHIH